MKALDRIDRRCSVKIIHLPKAGANRPHHEPYEAGALAAAADRGLDWMAARAEADAGRRLLPIGRRRSDSAFLLIRHPRMEPASAKVHSYQPRVLHQAATSACSLRKRFNGLMLGGQTPLPVHLLKAGQQEAQESTAFLGLARDGLHARLSPGRIFSLLRPGHPLQNDGQWPGCLGGRFCRHRLHQGGGRSAPAFQRLHDLGDSAAAADAGLRRPSAARMWPPSRSPAARGTPSWAWWVNGGSS